MSVHLTRRTLLAAGAAGAGTAVLAACGSSGGEHDTAQQSADATDGSSSGRTGSGTASATPSDSASGSSAAAATGLVALSTVPVGGAVAVTLADGKPGIVAQPKAGTAVAFSAICTHQGCTVVPSGSTLNCPCHQSVFNALTGAVESGPAPSALPSIAVTVQGGQVVAAG